MNLNLDNGPWKTILSGKFQEHDVEIVENPEHFYLTIIYDEQNGKKVGALIDGYKAFVARGNMEAFIQTLPKPCLGLEKNMGDKTYKMFFVSFNSLYVDFRAEDYLRKVDNEIRHSYDTINTILELARSSSLELRDINSCPEGEYAPLLGDPFTTRNLLSGLKKSALELVDLSDFSNSQTFTTSSIQLGLGKTREIIKEKTENLFFTSITGESKKGIHYSMYILAENMLIENRTILIFDSEDYFDGLSSASNNELALKEQLVDFEPAGFPTKRFTAKQDLKVSLRDSDLYLILDILKTGDNELQQKMALANINLETDTPQEFIGKINSIKDLNDFQKLKAERLMNLILQGFPDMFGRTIDPVELTKKWPGNLGRAIIVGIKELTPVEKTIFIQTILRLLNKAMQGQRDDKVMIFIPIFGETSKTGEDKLKQDIFRLEELGVGFVLGAEKVTPLIDTLTKTNIDVVSRNDVAVNIKGKRSYRVLLRPSLSGNPQP